jgi:disease resistance protein RPS2
MNLKDKDAGIVNHNCLLPNLQHLFISNCSILKDATWTTKLPSLECLYLKWCDEMETLLIVGNDDEALDERLEGTSGGGMQIHKERYHNYYFPKLKILHLTNLSSLKSISKPIFTLLFPSLKNLQVRKCPQLQNICLGPDSAKDLLAINGDQEWWDGLEWEDENTKSSFLPYFQQYLN